MGVKVIPILCYTKGEIKDGVHFSEPPSKGIIFEEGKGFDELYEVLNDQLGLPRGDRELEITCRCPATIASNSTRFIPLRLRNDCDVKFVVSMATHSEAPSCVELYIKRSETLESSWDPTASKWLKGLDPTWDAPNTFFNCKDWENSYKELPGLMNILTQTNKGTQVRWESSLTNQFKRVFWSFGAVIEGFKRCRPLIQVDSIPLFGKYKGKLLVASSVDSNQLMYPLAYAVVEEESDDSWSWFMFNLRTRVTHRDGICLITSMHKGIISVVNNPDRGWKEPRAYHRFCLQHVANNFDKRYKKGLKDLIYRAGCQHQKLKYEKCMKNLKSQNAEGSSFFSGMKRDKWAQSYDNGHRYGWMTTNLTEYMERVLEGATKLPVTTLVQLTFYHSVSIFEERRAEIISALNRGNIYTNYAVEKLIKWEERAQSHIVISLDKENRDFEVFTGVSGFSPPKGQNKQTVQLKGKSCSCNKWQSFGIPCSHAIAVCLYCHIDYCKFIEDYYKLSVYESCYSSQFQPIPHRDSWPQTELNIVHPLGGILSMSLGAWPKDMRGYEVPIPRF